MECRRNGVCRIWFPLLLLLLIQRPHVLAQISCDSTTRVYFTAGIGTGISGSSHPLSANLVFPSGWGFSLSSNTNAYTSSALPADYLSGFCPFGNCIPKDRIYHTTIALVRERALKKVPRMRFGLQAGPDFSTYRETKFIPNVSPYFFESNYDRVYSEDQFLGGMFMVRLNYDLVNWLAIQANLVTFINAHHSYSGIEIQMIIGRLHGPWFITPKI